MSMSRALALVWLIVGCRTASGSTPPALPMIGIDHIPLAVRDLESAAETYRRLGFTLKPGRFHENGIRNQHVKFEDGSGIELITAAAVRDSLTAAYVQMQSAGEGPAFLNFHTANLDTLARRLAAGGHAYRRDGNTVTLSAPNLDYLFFFAGDNRSPTDRPDYFLHANTARATIGVWIAGDDGSLVGALASLGATVALRQVFVPHEMTARVATVANGDVTFLPAARQIIPGRPIVGVVFKTGSLAKLRQVLAAAGIGDAVTVDAATYTSIVIPPNDARGIWLEFREQRP